MGIYHPPTMFDVCCCCCVPSRYEAKSFLKHFRLFFGPFLKLSKRRKQKEKKSDFCLFRFFIYLSSKRKTICLYSIVKTKRKFALKDSLQISLLRAPETRQKRQIESLKTVSNSKLGSETFSIYPQHRKINCLNIIYLPTQKQMGWSWRKTESLYIKNTIPKYMKCDYCSSKTLLKLYAFQQQVGRNVSTVFYDFFYCFWFLRQSFV